MRIWMGVATIALAGCSGRATKKEQPVALDKVPEAAMKVAREKLPEVTFERASLRENGVYEITGKSKSGKIHDVEVTATGEVLEVE